MKTLTKREACALLHISMSTLDRRMRAGKYQFTRKGDGQYAEVEFTYEGLALTEPAPDPVIPLEISHPAPEPEPEPEPLPEPSQVGPERTYATGWNADHSMFVSSEGVIFRRNSSGAMYRSDERLLSGRIINLPDSPSAADSCIRHPWSIEPMKNLEPIRDANAGLPGTVDNEQWKALWRR